MTRIDDGKGVSCKGTEWNDLKRIRVQATNIVTCCLTRWCVHMPRHIIFLSNVIFFSLGSNWVISRLDTLVSHVSHVATRAQALHRSYIGTCLIAEIASLKLRKYFTVENGCKGRVKYSRLFKWLYLKVYIIKKRFQLKMRGFNVLLA